MFKVVMESAPQFFNARAEVYDSLIRRVVPRYEEFTRKLVDHLPATAHQVVELGCGTGILSLALARRYPDARITFIDGAEEMVGVTRERVTAQSPGVAAHALFVAARFEDVELGEGDVDLITSSLSLHHVIDKQTLFNTLRSALRPGGRLCYADQFGAEPPEHHQRNWQEWIAFCRLPGNCTDEEVETVIAHSHGHDHYVPVCAQLEMLARAGFGELTVSGATGCGASLPLRGFNALATSRWPGSRRCTLRADAVGLASER